MALLYAAIQKVSVFILKYFFLVLCCFTMTSDWNKTFFSLFKELL